MKNEAFLFSLVVIWYISNFGLPPYFLYLFNKYYHNFDEILKFINYCNHMIYPDYFSVDENIDNEGIHCVALYDKPKEEEQKPPQKYEDKYLEDIRKLDKEFQFTEIEEEKRVLKFQEIWKELRDTLSDETEKIKTKIDEIEEKIIKSYEFTEDDYCIDDENNEDDEFLVEKKEHRILRLISRKNKLTETLTDLQAQTGTVEGLNIIMKKAVNQAKEFIIKQRLDKLKNCYVMENTPLGNVLMIYDVERETFRYYSDNTIPYRYLETVGRKYVKFYNCRPIFVDMEEELQLAEERWEKEKRDKEQKEEEEKRKAEELKEQNKIVEHKKSVFAKFKSYNKDSVAGKMMAAPPKNSIPNKQLTSEQENEKILLKEKANRYTYEGKISNFNFLKKVERKIVDKKYAMTFADFKKMQQDKK